jgi:predicted MFS family arabinose efflux permease
VAAKDDLNRSKEALQKTSLATEVTLFTLIRIVLNTAHRMVYPFLTAFARGLGVDLATLSYLMTARPLVGILGPVLATLTDKFGRKLGILAGVGLFTLAASLVLFSPTFPAFALAVILMTLGKYIFDVSVVAWLGDRVPYERRGRVIAITEFAWSLAFILGVPLVGLLIVKGSWNSPFLWFTLVGGVAFILVARFIPRDSAPTIISTNREAKKPMGAILRSQALLPILASLSIGLFCCAANETVSLIFGVWLEDAFGLQIAAIGAASAVIGIAELSGEGLVAAFVDRLGKTRSVMLGLLVNSLAALVLPWLGRTEAGALVGLLFFYLSFEFALVSIYPLMTKVLPSARGTIMALNLIALALGRSLGAFTGPRLYEHGFGTVAGGAIVFNLLAILGLWLTRRGKIHTDSRVAVQ